MSELRDLLGLFPEAPAWGTEQILPDGFLPMMPTPAMGPLESPDFGYEVRWEGLRVLAGLEADRLTLRSTAGQDVAFWYPEACGRQGLRAAAGPAWVLLEGELIWEEEGEVRAAGVLQRLRAGSEADVARMAAAHPVVFMAHDILRIGDSWLLDVTWEDRRDVLARAVRPTDGVRVSPVSADSAGALAMARALGLQSLSAHRRQGRYSPGQQSRDWLTIRPADISECVIGGWMEGRGARGGTIGSLLLGVREGARLVYVGHTGTGLDAQTLPALHRELLRLRRATTPFAATPRLSGEPHWVRPELRCRVRHTGVREDGKLRSPTFLGMTTPLRLLPRERRPRS